MEHHGTEFTTRFQKMGEQMRAMKEIWTKDVASFRGEHVNFAPIWCWPKPAQQPHPPVLLGGESSYTLQRVVDYCEGWFPRSRQPALVVNGMPGDATLLDTYRQAGVSRCILRLPSEGRDTILPLLDQYARLLG